MCFCSDDDDGDDDDDDDDDDDGDDDDDDEDDDDNIMFGNHWLTISKSREQNQFWPTSLMTMMMMMMMMMMGMMMVMMMMFKMINKFLFFLNLLRGRAPLKCLKMFKTHIYPIKQISNPLFKKTLGHDQLLWLPIV